MKQDLLKYKGYKIGDTLCLNVSGIHDMIPLERGTKVKVISFPPCVSWSKNKYFIYNTRRGVIRPIIQAQVSLPKIHIHFKCFMLWYENHMLV